MGKYFKKVAVFFENPLAKPCDRCYNEFNLEYVLRKRGVLPLSFLLIEDFLSF